MGDTCPQVKQRDERLLAVSSHAPSYTLLLCCSLDKACGRPFLLFTSPCPVLRHMEVVGGPFTLFDRRGTIRRECMDRCSGLLGWCLSSHHRDHTARRHSVRSADARRLLPRASQCKAICPHSVTMHTVAQRAWSATVHTAVCDSACSMRHSTFSAYSAYSALCACTANDSACNIDET